MTLHPFLAKIMENFEKCYLFYSLKKWSSIELKCIFSNYGIWYCWPLPIMEFSMYFFLNEGFPYLSLRIGNYEN